jgi:hypothetical protein
MISVCVYYILWYKVRKRVAIIYRSVVSIYTILASWYSLSLALSLSGADNWDNDGALILFHRLFVRSLQKRIDRSPLSLSIRTKEKKTLFSCSFSFSLYCWMLMMVMMQALAWPLHICFSICRHKTMEKGKVQVRIGRRGFWLSALNSKSASHASKHAFSRVMRIVRHFFCFLLTSSDHPPKILAERKGLPERDGQIAWFYDTPSLISSLLVFISYPFCKHLMSQYHTSLLNISRFTLHSSVPYAFPELLKLDVKSEIHKIHIQG